MEYDGFKFENFDVSEVIIHKRYTEIFFCIHYEGLRFRSFKSRKISLLDYLSQTYLVRWDKGEGRSAVVRRSVTERPLYLVGRKIVIGSYVDSKEGFGGETGSFFCAKDSWNRPEREVDVKGGGKTRSA